VVGEGHERIGRIASGYEQVDATVVEHAQPPLCLGADDGMVERRERVLDHEPAAHEEGCDETRSAAMGLRLHHEKHERGDGEDRAHAVRDRVGDLLALAVLTDLALLGLLGIEILCHDLTPVRTIRGAHTRMVVFHQSNSSILSSI